MIAMAEVTPAQRAPQHIGRYRIVERIGKGAMGLVYAADDESMGRRVAIKVMMADLEEEPETRERFYREARITGQLLHRNIVTVFDLGDDHGRPYIVMELLSGVGLAEYLRRPEAQPIDAKIDLMMQICDGLRMAHRRGVIHRDVKPSNVFIQVDGSLKLLDFGVARLATSNLTASGFLVGTPDYMSPEQAEGRQVDARSDVFSAAGVFYYMLSGRAPFASPDLPRVLHGVLHDDPPPLGDHEAPEALRRVLQKALAKQPDARYQSCDEMLVDLDRARRMHAAAARQIAQAALDRYRQVIATIGERRALGRAFGVAGIDATCDRAVQRLAAQYPMLATDRDAGALVAPVDHGVATAALATLQARHNAELGAVAALRQRAEAHAAAPAAPASSVPAAADEIDVDVTTVRPTPLALAAEPAAPSWADRAASLWRRITGASGQSTTEWLMIAGILSAVGIFLVGIVPNGLGTFMKAMAASLRTVAP